jgi:nucleoid-associated protein YgaU
MGRYKNTKVIKSTSGKLYRSTKFYTPIPESSTDVWVITQHGDRLDLLANQYYQDPSMWWYIARANNLKFNNLEAGTTIRIPAMTVFNNE